MTEEIKMGEAGPIYTEAETNALPGCPEACENDPVSVQRLCEYDEAAQTGCRRTGAMLNFEAEFDTYVLGDMYWGGLDTFFQHEGHIYYEKKFLEKLIGEDNAARVEIASRADIQAAFAIINAAGLTGYTAITEPLTLDSVKSVIKAGPAGFPTVLAETPHFFECEDVGQNQITIDSLDRATLDLIKNTFTGDVHPLCSNVAQTLYLKDGKVFGTEILAFENIPNGKLGVLMIPTTTEKYEAGKAYFFPFNALTAEQEAAVKAMGRIESDFNAETTIVTL